MARSEEDARQLIGQDWIANPGQGRKKIVARYMERGYSRSFIYKTIKRAEKGSPLKTKPIPGRPPKDLTPKSKRRLRYDTDGKVASSINRLAKKYKRSHRGIKRILFDMGIERKKRIVAPDVTPNQIETQKQRLRRARHDMLRPSNGLDPIQDDESYFTLSRSCGNEYYFQGRKEVDRNVKFLPKKKFEAKVLVWIAISRRGRSKPVILTSKMAIDAQKYQDLMIKGPLFDFIDRNYPNGGYIFWPDLASSHYAKSTLQVLDRLGITYLPKDQNPPNAPQIRPIELFWAHLKSKVYADGWSAQNVDQLKSRIIDMIETFSDAYFVDLMAGVKTKVRKASDQGLDSLIEKT